MTAFILAVIVNNYNTGQVSPNILFPFIVSPICSLLCAFPLIKMSRLALMHNPEQGNRRLLYIIFWWNKRKIDLEV